MAKVLLQLYPRGFLGEQTVPQTGPSSGRSRPVPHLAVEKLYTQYINRAVNTTSSEFRRKILIVALRAFGTRDFEVWLSSQHQSPVAGDNHMGFLEDTVQFLATGKRDLDVQTWLSILDGGDTGEVSSGHSELAKEFFGISSNGLNREPRNRSMVDVVQVWCSHPGGIEDILCTLHVLFGNVTSKSIAMGDS